MIRADLELAQTALCPMDDEEANVKQEAKTDFLFKCTECKYKSNNRTYFAKHVDVHMNIRPFKCEYCEKTFRDTNQLNNHVNTHIGKKPFVCDECDAKFSTRGEVTRHKKYKHSFIKPHKCEHCDYSTVELSKLKRHVRIHTGERPYLCQYCDYASSDTFKLKRHLRIHTGEKPYECPVCKSRFNQSNSLKYHLAMMHNDKSDAAAADAVKLEDLPASSSNKENNMDDESAPKPAGHVSLPLAENNATFETKNVPPSSPSNDEQDSGIAENSNIYVNSAPSASSSEPNLSPGASNSSSSNGTASSCGGAAESGQPSADAMIKSMLSGVEEFKKMTNEIFTCTKCNVKFTSQELLDEHSVKHTGERPYKCEICGISFGKKFAMRAHMQSHESKKPTSSPVAAPVVIKPALIAAAPGTSFVYGNGSQLLNMNNIIQIGQPATQLAASGFPNVIILNGPSANTSSIPSGNIYLKNPINNNITSVTSKVQPLIINNGGLIPQISLPATLGGTNGLAADAGGEDSTKRGKLISNILLNPASIPANFNLVTERPKETPHTTVATLVCAPSNAEPNVVAYNSSRSHQTIRSILGINTKDSALVSTLPPLPKSMLNKPSPDVEDDPLFQSTSDLPKSKPSAASKEKADKKKADDEAKYSAKKPDSKSKSSLMKEKSKSDSCLRKEDDKSIDESIDDAVLKSIEAMKSTPTKLGLTDVNLIPFKRGKRKFSQQMLQNTFVIPRENSEDKLKESIAEELLNDTGGTDTDNDTSPKKIKKETTAADLDADECDEEKEEVPVDKEIKELIKAKNQNTFLSAILVCSFCDQKFPSKVARSKHVRMAHSKKSASLQNLSYNDRDSLVSHLDATATDMNHSYLKPREKS